MKPIRFGRLAPFFKQEFGQRRGMEQVEKEPVEEARVLIRFVFLDVDSDVRSFALFPTASSQPLHKDATDHGAHDLTDDFDVADVDAHLQGAGTKGESRAIRLQVLLGLFAFSLGQRAVMNSTEIGRSAPFRFLARSPPILRSGFWSWRISGRSCRGRSQRRPIPSLRRSAFPPRPARPAFEREAVAGSRGSSTRSFSWRGLRSCADESGSPG